MNAFQKAKDSAAELLDVIGLARQARMAFRLRSVPPIKPGRQVLVIPRGRNFFHLQDAHTGRVLGFRSGHPQACAAARDLEQLAVLP